MNVLSEARGCFVEKILWTAMVRSIPLSFWLWVTAMEGILFTTGGAGFMKRLKCCFSGKGREQWTTTVHASAVCMGKVDVYVRSCGYG
jgi:hypothetical protein